MKAIYLVHDDQPEELDRRAVLEEAGYEVTAMQNVEDCLQLLGERLPAAVVLDVLIHGKNGFEACREIRTLFGEAEVPILLCSEVYRSRVFRDEATHAGAQAYLLKPVKQAELLKQVNKLTGGPEAEEADQAA